MIAWIVDPVFGQTGGNKLAIAQGDGEAEEVRRMDVGDDSAIPEEPQEEVKKGVVFEEPKPEIVDAVIGHLEAEGATVPPFWRERERG